MPQSFSAVLLAAGHSTRMGRDKALLEIDDAGRGIPLWRWQRDTLARAGAGEIFLSARPEQAWSHRADGFAAVVHDSHPNSGPLAGLTAALERAAHPHLAVLAIDLPRMSAEWLAALRAECAPGVGAVGRRGGGELFFEPLAAIYPREILPLAQVGLARGEFSLQRLLAAAVEQRFMRVREITSAEAPLFENWNARELAPAKT